MRIAAEKRADDVFVAAGVELIEPEFRHKYGVDQRLGWQTAKRLRAATGDPDNRLLLRRMPVLKACGCSAPFVGDANMRHCPACKRAAVLVSTREAVKRLRAKRRLPLARKCRQCGAPMTASRSTKVFCSEKCRVAAHRAAQRGP